MTRHKYKLISVLFAFLLAITTIIKYPLKVYAASATVSASASTIYVGDSVTFTVNVSGGAGYITVSGAASDYIWLDQSSQSYTVKGDSVGTLQVSISGVIADVNTEQDQTVSGSATVKVIERPTVTNPPVTDPDTNNNGVSNNTPTYETPTTGNQTVEEPKSSNADLSSLSISTGTLSPEFISDKTNYTVVLEKNVTALTVQASPKDDKATVSGTGEISLKPGNNEITITVTAEDGTTKKYVIKAMVDESPDVFVNYNGKKLGVVKNTDDAQVPATFEKTMVSLEGKNVEAWHSNLSNLTIIYMIDDKNEKNFYLYDESSKMISSVYKPIALLGRQVAIIDIPKELQTRVGMNFGEVEVDSLKFSGWIFEDEAFENYVLLYLMDDKGKMHYYLYEKSENTLQLYSDQAAVTQNTFDQLNEDMKLRMIVLIVLAGTNVLTLLLLIIVMLRKKKKRKAVIEPKSKKHQEIPEANHEEDSDEIIEPFDSWKYEPVNQEHTIHMKPYDEEQHLFDERDDTHNG